jgi:hypothetical protein
MPSSDSPGVCVKRCDSDGLIKLVVTNTEDMVAAKPWDLEKCSVDAESKIVVITATLALWGNQVCQMLELAIIRTSITAAAENPGAAAVAAGL